MGYRLHYAQHYHPSWQGGYFNWDIDKWEDLFCEKFYPNGWRSENEDMYEVQRIDVQKYVDELKKLPAEDFNEFFPNDFTDKQQPNGYTNKQVIEILEEILLSDDDTIRLECF